MRGVGINLDILNQIKEKIFDKCKEKLEIKFINVEQISPSLSGKPEIITRGY